MTLSTSSIDVVIVINPGSTSTKYALWSRAGGVAERTVRHEADRLAARAIEQFEYRRALIDADLAPLLSGVRVVGSVGRGGLLKPLPGGVYKVSEAMLAALQAPETSNHASNLGALLADHYARRFGVGAFIVDPVTVDEFHDLARLSGVVWCERKSRSHALNIKAVVRRACRNLGIEVRESRFVVAHLGGGISIAAVKGGRLIDANDALHGMGPYSPERAGALPIGPLIEHCFSGVVSKKELLDELARRSGLTAYTGTSDAREVLGRIADGDTGADLALRGMVYQIAKEIGAYATVLKGELDAVILTGGLAHSNEIVEMVRSYIIFLGRVIVLPGEGELEALAEGAFRVLDGEESALEYH